MGKNELTGKKALISGAGSGIGRAVALSLAERGMKLALVGPDVEALVRTAALTGRPLDMLVLPVDLEKPRAIQDIMRILTGHFKALDILVNCPEDAQDASNAVINEGEINSARTLNVEANCCFWHLKLPTMRLLECPTIVNIDTKVPGQGAICGATMGALRSIVKALAYAVTPEDMRGQMEYNESALIREITLDQTADVVAFLLEHRDRTIFDAAGVQGYRSQKFTCYHAETQV